MEPSYLKAHKSGKLKEAAEVLKQGLRDCCLCPRNCHADRLSGDLGTCKTGELAEVSSFMPHYGEESPISGRKGSGTIFFTHCNLLCNFCQNYNISHEGKGRPVSPEELANMMLSLQNQGCHNINFVTPSHVVVQILQALMLAVEGGLHIPLVYNSGGYDHVSTLQYLEGIFDIYMPDFKFWDRNISSETCEAPDYPEVAKLAILEMYRQAGDLVINYNGIAEKGLLVRHLVMPNGVAGSSMIMEFIAGEVSRDTYVNILSQYHPCGKAFENNKLSRVVSHSEIREAVDAGIRAGLSRMDQF